MSAERTKGPPIPRRAYHAEAASPGGLPLTGGDGRRPRILILNQYYNTFDATGQILLDLCDDLARTFEVTVIAAQPSTLAEEGRGAGVRVVTARATRFGRSSLVLRALNYATFCLSALLALLRVGKHDAVLCLTDPPVVGLLGLAYARARRVSCVVVFQDVFPEAGVISGVLTNRLVVRFLRGVQRILVRRADHLVTIADAMRDRLVERGADAERVTVIPNWADLEQVTPEPRGNEWAQDHDLADGFTVMHSGNVGLLHSLETLITAARQAVRTKFVIVGDGAAKPRIVECARQHGAANVRFLPYQPRSLLRYSLAAADVHVVSLMPGVAGFVEAAKIYGVLAAGRPVVAAVDEWSEAARLVREAQCGMVVSPGDPQELAAAVQRMAELPAQEREQLGHRAREIAEARCGREQATNAYRRLIATITSGESRRRSRGNARLVAPL